jgi:hypothetical protein
VTVNKSEYLNSSCHRGYEVYLVIPSVNPVLSIAKNASACGREGLNNPGTEHEFNNAYEAWKKKT